MNHAFPKKCRLCGIELEAPEVIADFVYGGRPDQKFYHCSNCDVAFLHPPMTEEEESQFYANEFEKFMERRSGGDFDWSGPEAHVKSNIKQYERRLRFFSELIVSGKSVLEIGCSSGFMLFPLQEKGLTVVGIEPSGGFSGFLKSKGIEVYPSLTDFQAFCRIKQFDLVLHFFVLEHMRNPIAFLNQVFELVKSGGHMIFEIPNRSDPLLSIYNIGAFQKFYWSVVHNYYFNQRSVKFIVEKVTENYEIINEQRYDLSNHITWALEGKPGGQGKYSAFYTPELELAYRQSMVKTGYCDTLICRLQKAA